MRWLSLVVILALIFLSSADDDDSGEHRKEHHESESGDDSSQENSSEEQEDYPPKRWVDTLHPGLPRLSLKYLDRHLAVYFDKGVNRSDAWPFKDISKAWKFVKLTYGPFARAEDTRLWLHAHSWKVEPQALPSRVNDGRNTIDLQADAESVLESVVVQMAKLVESTVQCRNFSLILSTVARPWPVLAFQIYKNVSSRLANKWVAKMMACGENDRTKAAFTGWYHPIGENYQCAKVFKRFFKIVAEQWPEQPMSWAEFLHFWSAAAEVDLRALLTSAFRMKISQEDVDKCRNRFPKYKYCVSN